METFDIIKWVAEILLPVLTGLAGFFAGKRKRDNDFLSDLQRSINALSEDNAKLIRKTIDLNQEVIALRKENAELKEEVEALRKENAALRDEIGELKSQLDGVKTITRIRKDA
jgi:septal ring factor EnvC (AmiA/AmiB activator)